MKERFRSWLFSPATAPGRCQKALQSHADQIIWDLEDAVAETDKDGARHTVAKLLDQQSSPERKPWIRVNPPGTSAGKEDLAVITGVVAHDRWVIPKADATTVASLLDVDLPGVWLLLIESGQGIWDLRNEIWGRVDQARVLLAFGSLDYQEDVGISSGPDELELLAARSELVLACRAWGLAAPIDGVYPRLTDEEGLIAATRRAMQMGFQGKLLVHPRQIDPVHQALAPSADEVSWATEIVDRWGKGQGVITVDGVMVDRPVLQKALRILGRTDPDQARTEETRP